MQVDSTYIDFIYNVLEKKYVSFTLLGSSVLNGIGRIEVLRKLTDETNYTTLGDFPSVEANATYVDDTLNIEGLCEKAQYCLLPYDEIDNTPLIDKQVCTGFLSLKDERKGLFFDNLDTTSSDICPDWGMIVTPDEIRFVGCFGNELVAPNGDQITDENIVGYIKEAVAEFETEFHDYKLTKERRYPARFVSYPIGTDYENLEYEEEECENSLESGKTILRSFSPYLQIWTNKFPIKKINSISYSYAYDNKQYSLSEYVRDVNYKTGKIKFDNIFTPREMPSRAYSNRFNSLENYQTGLNINVDYIAGYSNVSKIPKQELFLIHQYIFIVALNNVLRDYGDGKVAGIASQSISLAGISESYGTTLSATSAYFGARMIQLNDKLKLLTKNMKKRFSRMIPYGVGGRTL